MIYLSLGSNVDPETNLPKAVDCLQRFGRLVAASTVWETEPIGFREQPNFLNACVLFETQLGAREVQSKVIPWIEEKLDRIRGKNKSGPRSIDVDIMLFDDEILKLGHRHVPSPEIYERAFVAIPLAEISPHKVHPETGERLEEIATRFSPEDWGMIRRDEIHLTSGKRSDLDPASL